jgi:hypothetical protein
MLTSQQTTEDRHLQPSNSEDKALNKEESDTASTHKPYDFYLKRILKENHGLPVVHCSFFPSIAMTLNPTPNASTTTEENYSMDNLLLTQSPNQINVYDNQHLGTHLDLVSQFEIPNSSNDVHSPFF